MSKKKANQFLCSSMMLPEHRERLAERSLRAAREEKERVPGGQPPEELARYLNQSFFTRRPVNILVKTGGEILPATGVIVDSNASEGTVSLRTHHKIKVFPLDSIIRCRPAAGDLEPD